jgi:hypothetical protein
MSDLEWRVKQLEDRPDGCGCLVLALVLLIVSMLVIDMIWPTSIDTTVETVWVAFARAVVAAGALP